jgi:hypothetical protein
VAEEANSHLDPLIRKLESIAPVSDAEKRAIAALPITLRGLKADQDIVRDLDRPSQCCVLLEGFACRYKVLHSGKHPGRHSGPAEPSPRGHGPQPRHGGGEQGRLHPA